MRSSDLLWYGLAFVTAASIVAFMTPLTIHVATTFKIHDAPDGRLKKHREPTPYLGGLAVACGFVIAFGLLASDTSMGERALGILVGAFMMLLLGLYDDLTNLRPGVKFLGQLLAVVALHKAGVRIELAALDFWGNLALTALWMTGITNAFNIIDVMDGLATGVAFFAAIFLFLISGLTQNDPQIPFMAVVLAGALLGFLRFNFTPARIFLGDTGSLFIGFMIGALSMLVSYSGEAGQSELVVFTPLLLLAVPIFDTGFVALHRARQGIPFFRGSPDHFALRLSHSGWGVRRTVLGVYRVCFLLGILAVTLVFGPAWLAPWVIGTVAVGVLVALPLLSRLPAPPRRTEASP
ncbi:MAG: glycosyltransferase family 4 protein [Planctomycetota bacterium]